MKIGAASFYVIPSQPANYERAVDNDVHDAHKQQQSEGKQAWKEEIQRQVSMMLASQGGTGEHDPRAQQLIEKFKSGKKLARDEMAYIRQNALGMAMYIERIVREREELEQRMRIAPTKNDVQLAVLYASTCIAKQPASEESVVRVLHIADAQHEYVKTAEYREKPAHTTDRQDQPASYAVRKARAQYYSHQWHQGCRMGSERKKRCGGQQSLAPFFTTFLVSTCPDTHRLRPGFLVSLS